MTSDSDPRSQKLGEIIADYLAADEHSQIHSWGQLQAEYPDLAHELQEFFDQREKLQQAASRVNDPPILEPETSSETNTIPTSDVSCDEATLAPQAVQPAGSAIRDRTFGDYELLEEIERGGMGVVYKARQVSLNRIVALKMILAGQLASEEEVKRFHAEAEAAANLDHPGIVPIYEVGEHEGQHYFSMSYVKGTSLARKIADGPLPPVQAAEVTKKAAEAVAFAHEHGVIHRDLKPANVLLDPSGQPKVTDFGLAKKVKAASNMTRTGQILGTPSFMPPEQASGQHHEINETADVYSLGAILYALVTGRPPFQADNQLDTLFQVMDQQPVSPRTLNPKIPRDLETICLKCLEKNHRRRYASAGALAEELGRFLEDQPIHARPLSAPARAWRWCVRKPVVASLTALATISLILGVSVSTYFAIVAGKRAETALELQQQERELKNTAQESQKNEHRLRRQGLCISAKFAARTIANQVDVRWRILEKMAADAQLHNAIEPINNEPTQQSHWQALQEWLDENAEQHALLRVRSFFVNAVDGTQVARSPSHTDTGERYSSLGGNYNYRDYFHGRGRDFYVDKDLRRPPLTLPHNAAVHESSNEGALTVVFSVPIRAERDSAAVGVLGMSIHLGSFASLEADLPTEQHVLLVDTRNYYMEREYPDLHEERGEGLVLHHRSMEDLRDLGMLPHIDDMAVQYMLEHKKQLGEETSSHVTADPILDGFHDPLSKQIGSRSLAAFAPVTIMTRPAVYSDTGWFVIIQQSE